ncbi:hypothetical protein DAEQUDRAFT_740234 [Daedalea quercina L-15889]|uniref:Uncharacterized protein n=1 Tax=Daedalea quercina L-15889 TaxID=1314783 RepID=A0A165MSF8_9APHY|nr:hypothetical protein DAEQUDRAFT_740234 [Daedalea quercina L-15889]
MTKDPSSAPACCACTVDPASGINQHAWLVNAVLTAWRKATSTESCTKLAKQIASGFDDQFKTNVRKQIKKWILNHKYYFDAQRSNIPRLLEVPVSLTSKSQRHRAKSVRDLFIRDHSDIGRVAKKQSRDHGSNPSGQVKAVNEAYTKATDGMRQNKLDEWRRYVEESRQSKAVARAARASAQEDAAVESEDVVRDPVEPQLLVVDRFAQLQCSARRTANSWAQEAGTEVIIYVAGLDPNGRLRKSLISAGRRGPDDIVQRIKASPLIDTLNGYVTQVYGERIGVANQGPSGQSAPRNEGLDRSPGTRDPAGVVHSRNPTPALSCETSPSGKQRNECMSDRRSPAERTVANARRPPRDQASSACTAVLDASVKVTPVERGARGLKRPDILTSGGRMVTQGSAEVPEVPVVSVQVPAPSTQQNRSIRSHGAMSRSHTNADAQAVDTPASGDGHEVVKRSDVVQSHGDRRKGPSGFTQLNKEKHTRDATERHDSSTAKGPSAGENGRETKKRALAEVGDQASSWTTEAHKLVHGGPEEYTDGAN